jgi:hypothetical protein
LGTLKINTGFVQLVQKAPLNFAAFLKKDSDTTSTEKRLCGLCYRIISKMLNLVPTDMQIANLTFNDNGKKATIGIKELTLFDQQLET